MGQPGLVVPLLELPPEPLPLVPPPLLVEHVLLAEQNNDPLESVQA